MKAVRVATIRFRDSHQEGPGFNSTSLSSCWSPGQERRSRHKIEYHPWARQFWIEHYSTLASSPAAEMLDAAYLPLECVAFWRPVDGPIAAPVPQRSK